MTPKYLISIGLQSTINYVKKKDFKSFDLRNIKSLFELVRYLHKNLSSISKYPRNINSANLSKS